MAIEQTLESIATSLAAIATILQTQAQAVTTLGSGTGEVAATEKKTRAKKSDAAVPNEVVTPAPAQVAATPVTEVAATPVVDTPVATPASSVLPWTEVLAKVIEVNKSELPTAGRKGVQGILSHFFGDGAVGKKVPDLEALNRHADVLAFATGLLAAPAPADDDLGL